LQFLLAGVFCVVILLPVAVSVWRSLFPRWASSRHHGNHVEGVEDRKAFATTLH
jgi:hypothetical protein